MKTEKIKRIVKKISKIYGVENYFTVTRLNKNKIELRTELPYSDGGRQLSQELEKEFIGWICENCGGCVYVLYRPI